MGQFEAGLNKSLSVVEQWSNVAGYIPRVSSLSGSYRVSLGSALMIGSIAAAALVVFSAMSAPTAEEQRLAYKKAFTILTTYFFHGVVNVFRGTIEMVPLLSLVTCLPYDLMKFRISYPHEGNYRLVHGF